MSKIDELSNMITPLVEKADYRLWSLNITKAAKRSIVTVTLDKDGGANLDEMAEVSKEIAAVIDEHPSFEEAYHLEVESPGLERALTSHDHYEWSKNMEVSVSFRDGQTLSRSRGILKEVNDDNLVIEEIPLLVKKSKNKQAVEEPLGAPTLRTIEISSITKANTVFDFDQAMKRDSKSKEEDQTTESENI